MPFFRMGLVGLLTVALLSGCGGGSATTDEVRKGRQGIEQLPREDQQAALDQWSCPVSGDMLGTDGEPVKLEVGGKVLFFKNQECADQYASSPAKFESRRTE